MAAFAPGLCASSSCHAHSWEQVWGISLGGSNGVTASQPSPCLERGTMGCGTDGCRSQVNCSPLCALTLVAAASGSQGRL